jgi:hypothetical protein
MRTEKEQDGRVQEVADENKFFYHFLVGSLGAVPSSDVHPDKFVW